MPELKGSIVTAEEVKHFYQDNPGYWFLLEVQKVDEQGRAESMRVVDYDRDKEVLREKVFDELERQHGKFILVFANPDGTCDLG